MVYHGWMKRVSQEVLLHFIHSRHGLEKESLRVDAKGRLSNRSHPSSLGAPLFHPWFSLDFSEAQLEMITPHFSTVTKAINFLQTLHIEAQGKLSKGELLWPTSTPCTLPAAGENIPLANFGSSNKGETKKTYRRGLGFRYGRKMQTLSGVHYNFSFTRGFFEALYTEEKKGKEPSEEGFQKWISEKYMHLVRNFLREGWFTTYLFGATPVADKSYQKQSSPLFQPWGKESFYLPEGTSLRMSPFGYYSKVQAQWAISYNTLASFVRDLRRMCSTIYPPFQKFALQGAQLNDYALQIEAEHYSRIRPKPQKNEKRVWEDLQNQGVGYVEVRSLDIYPFSSTGVEQSQLIFHSLFLLYCLLKPSAALTKEEQKELVKNQENVALKGRKKGLHLLKKGKKVSLQSWGEEILEQMEKMLEPLQKTKEYQTYRSCIEEQRVRVFDRDKTLSAMLLKEMEGKEHTEFYLKQARAFRGLFAKESVSAQQKKKFDDVARESIQRKEKEEAKDDYLLTGFEDWEVSSQMLIREAKKQSIEVQVVDKKEQVLLLQKGKVKQVVKQATFTERDSVLSYFLMGNKSISKDFLEKEGFRVPGGALVHSEEEALRVFKSDFDTFVLKPNTTNYGIGISFVRKKDKKGFIKAAREAFSWDAEILVEEFVSGDEYRFLVIDGRCVAVCRRVPAHVDGDGKKSIRQLVEEKNQDPRCYKQLYPLKLGKKEKDFLDMQGLKPSSVPAKGKRVFLRKNSNVSTGGDSFDATNLVHSSYKKIAQKAAKLFGGCFCGIDILLQDPSKEARKENHAIIELNYNPALYLHRYPLEGQERFVEKDVLKALGF